MKAPRRHRYAGFFHRLPGRRHFEGAVEDVLTTLGVGSQTATDIAQPLVGGAVGAGLGAAGAAIAGGNVGTGALIGGGVGAAGGVLQDLGVLPSFGGGGGGGGATTATDPMTGAPLTTPTGATAGSAAAPAGMSAAGAAPPAGVSGGIDLTAGATDPFASGGGGLGSGVSTGGAGGGAGAVTTAGGATATPVSSGTQLWNDITSGNASAIPGDIGSAIVKNPGAAVAGGGLLLNMMRGNQNVQGVNQLTGEAAQLASQGKLLSSYLQTGNLPPGVKTAIDQATASAISAVRGKYASMGIPGSTAEIQEINNIRMNAATQGVQVAENLLKTGISEVGLSSGIYESLININQQQAASTGAAIASFAQALSGFTPGKTIQIAA